MLRLPKNASEKLTEIEARLRSLREEKARAVRVVETARAAALAVPEGEDDNGQYEAAEQAVAAVKAIEATIERVKEDQIALLGTAGGPGTWSGIEGWSQIARGIDLEHGNTSVHVPLGSLLAQDGGFGVPTGGSTVATQRVPLSQPAQDNRFLFPSIPQRPLDDGTLAVVDFVQTGSRAVTGSVERDPLSTANKAELGLALTAESEDVHVGEPGPLALKVRDRHLAEYRKLVDQGETTASIALEEVERIDWEREQQQQAIEQAEALVSEWSGPPDVDAALDFYNGLVEQVKGRIQKAEGARELHDALSTVVAGLWAEIEEDRERPLVEFELLQPKEATLPGGIRLLPEFKRRRPSRRRASWKTVAYPTRRGGRSRSLRKWNERWNARKSLPNP